MIKNFNKLVLVVADLDNRNPIFFLFISIFRYTKLKNIDREYITLINLTIKLYKNYLVSKI